MIFRTILGLLIVLISCSCAQQTSKGEHQTENAPNQHLKSKAGLKIEYKPTRGQPYTDTLGTKYSLRHIPATITNDSTIPIHVQIAFSKEYDYPIAYNDEQFKVFPMPKEWALDGVEITDSTYNELPKYIDKPFLNKTLEPGEKFVVAFGTLYPHPINYGVFPMAVFSQNNRAFHHDCDSLIIPNKSTNPHLVLELNLGFTSGSQASPESCTIIPCGQISYPER